MQRLKVHFTRKRRKQAPRQVDVDITVPLTVAEWVNAGDEITFDLKGGMEDEDGEPLQSVRVRGIIIDRVRYE